MEETTLQKLANATVTYYQCNGHSKAERNKAAMEEYREELTKQHQPVPLDDELLKLGTFNGDGAR